MESRVNTDRGHCQAASTEEEAPTIISRSRTTRPTSSASAIG